MMTSPLANHMLLLGQQLAALWSEDCNSHIIYIIYIIWLDERLLL